MSRAAKLALLFVAAATIAAEIVAILGYRHSSDGQVGVLWLFIAIYGIVAACVVVAIDALVRRVCGRKLL